jgi:hypothetical protein
MFRRNASPGRIVNRFLLHGKAPATKVGP